VYCATTAEAANIDRKEEQRTVTESPSVQFQSMGAPATHDTVIVPMTAAMVGKAARLHRDALANSRTAIMGASYVKVFIDWFRQAEPGRIALVAIDSHSDVVGYVIGAPLGYSRALSRHLVWVSIAAIIVRPWLLFRHQFRKGVLDRLWLLLGRSIPHSIELEPYLPAPTMSLVAIGVAPDVRRKKIGQHLVQSFEARARQQQMQSLRLSTLSDNEAACRLYERCGWRPFPASDEMTYYCRILGE
jgi:ribosomal protein S18 acetylase RimI-like enzyme